MYQLHSSIREKPAAQTYQIARQYFKKLGISRVTETTRLDRIGMPVAVAIRPTASKGSLIVTAGKGIAPIEAMTGAAMEAIEIAFSEERHSHLKSSFVPASRILNTAEDPGDILRLCPISEIEIDLEASMQAIKLKDLISGNEKYLPSELLFVPFSPKENETRYFGYHTNGLASGNSYEEAVIHALYEVIERDILSFEYIQENALLVPVLSLPQSAQNLIARITKEGLELVVKTVVNPHEIPFFKAYIIDKWAANPTLLNAGYGCHGNAQIALMRALAEAAQSRMSYIHGGREDLTKGYQSFSDQNEDLSQKFNDLYASIQHAKGEIHFNTIQSLTFSAESTRYYLDQLITHIQKTGIVREIYIGRHTQNHDSLQVVKAIIPDMEFYNNETNRIGPRLLHFIQNLTL